MQQRSPIIRRLLISLSRRAAQARDSVAANFRPAEAPPPRAAPPEVDRSFFDVHGGLGELPSARVPAAVAMSMLAWKELVATRSVRPTLRPVMVMVLSLGALRRARLRLRAKAEAETSNLGTDAREEFARAAEGHAAMSRAFSVAAESLRIVDEAELTRSPEALCPLCSAPPAEQHPDCRGSGHVWDREKREFVPCPHSAPLRQAMAPAHPAREAEPCAG